VPLTDIASVADDCGEPTAKRSELLNRRLGNRVPVRFSVFIPAYNDARWLPGTIESVQLVRRMRNRLYFNLAV